MSFVIFDRATYHTVLEDHERYPVTSWNKDRLISTIQPWNGPPNYRVHTRKAPETKSELLEQARLMYPAPNYKI